MAEEEERLVLPVIESGNPHWPAESPAELIALDLVPAGRCPVTRVEYAVAHEFERSAVELVGARFGDDVDDSSGILPVLRAVVAGLHAELEQRDGHGKRLIDVGVLVHIIAAIELIIHGSL